MRLLLGILLLFLLPMQIEAANELSLTEHGEYTYDSSGRWSIEDILAKDDLSWQPIENELSLGLVKSVVWVKLPIPENPTLLHDQGILSLSNQLINDAWIFVVKNKTLITGVPLGDHIQINKKQIKVSDIYWLLPKGWLDATHIYVRIDSDSFMQSHFKIKSVATAIEDHGARYWMLGLFYGALSIMFVYNLFVFFQVKDVRYLYYTGYVISAGLFHAAMDGLPYYYLSSVYELKIDRMSVYFVDLTNIFAILFVTKFLELKESRLLKATRTLIYVFFLAMLVEVFEHGHLSTIFSTVMTVVTSLSITYITISTWLRGNELARYLALAWIVLIISIPIYILALNGFIPHNVFTLNSVRVGVVFELALLSFSLAHRINLLKQDRLELQRRLNKGLGVLVKDRTEELVAANKKLQELSETDALTQLKNRAFFDVAIVEELARAQRNGSTLSILIADLDHFKRVNDDLGHNAGDYCLKHFSQVFEARLTRAIDIACRYGGEEFIAILPETELEGALKVAERIREGVDNSQIIFEGTPIPLTVSIGVLSSAAHSTWKAHDWVAKADEALYFAKQRRNQVAYVEGANAPTFADASTLSN